MTKRKKPSPSTMRRNLQRKEQFLRQKSETSSDKEATSQAEATFQCEHCESSFKTEIGLKIHVGKAHNALKSGLSPEKLRVFPQEPPLYVSPVRNTKKEEIEAKEEEEAPPLPEEQTVQRHFSVESLCSFDRLGDHLEAELNRDVVKNFEVHEKERLSKKYM